jgi:hypothetical protein
MKPSDHPDFFRLPPPPGRSRESRIVLDEQGRFWNAGDPIEHEAMTQAFSSWITTHPDDGRFILTNGYDWTYFTVKDAPFLVKHVEVSPAGARLRLSDGTEEGLDPAGVEIGENGVLYTWVKGRRFLARFTPRAQAAMVDLVEEGPDGEPRLTGPSGSFSIAQRASNDPAKRGVSEAGQEQGNSTPNCR